ncbi:MAG: phosphotransferase [Myxococcota bacterium]|nr:phosphotransferase [Myxococcota bacterium]
MRSPELAGTRRRPSSKLTQELACIRIDLETPLDLSRLGPEGSASVGSMLAELRTPRPALELALHWLREHLPPLQEVTLLHGDFRTGNYLVTPRGLSALLDWEFSHFGSPLQDVAWFCLRDWRFGQLRPAAGGLCPRAVFDQAYKACSERRVDPDVVRWFEVLGNARWAGCGRASGTCRASRSPWFCRPSAAAPWRWSGRRCG